MNWGKGLLRLWIVFSVIWVAASIWTWQPNVAQSMYVVTAPDGQKYSVTADVGTAEADVLAYAQHWHETRKKDVQAAITKARADQRNGVKGAEDDARKLEDYLKNLGPESAMKEFPIVLQMPHGSHIWQMVLWALGVPISLLALGLSVGWVARGFRTSS